MKISIFEFLKKLETGNGDQVLELVSTFQSGGIDFTDFNYDFNEDISDDDDPPNESGYTRADED